MVRFTNSFKPFFCITLGVLAVIVPGRVANAEDTACKIIAVTSTSAIKKGAVSACKTSKNKVVCSIAATLESKVGERVAETAIEGVCKVIWKKDEKDKEATIEIVPVPGKEKEVDDIHRELKSKAPDVAWKLK